MASTFSFAFTEVLLNNIYIYQLYFCKVFFSPSPTNSNDFVTTYQPGLTVDIGKISICRDLYAAKGDKTSTALSSLLCRAANANPEEKVRGYE